MAIYPEMKGKAAIITGGAGGIGFAAAKRLTENFCSVLIADVSDTAKDIAVAELTQSGANALGYKVDVRDEESVQGMVDACIGAYGRIDYLVNSAGIFKSAPLLEMTMDQWRETIDINLTGTFLCMQKCARYMIGQKSGNIVNLSSYAAMRGSVNHAHYCASKEGVIGLTRAFMKEVALHGIRVNSVAPDIIKTHLTMNRVNERMGAWMDRIPMKRFGETEECADLILYLLSDASSYITGQNLCITGGAI